MRRSNKTNGQLKEGLSMLGVAVLVIAALPFLVVTVFMARFVVLAAILAAIPVVVLTPSLRTWLLGAAEGAASYKGLRVPADVWVHPQHAWARAESGDTVVVGVDDLAPRVLGPLDEVHLPAPGALLVEGEDMLWLRRGERALAIKAPVSGTVLSVNTRAAADPGIINQSPYAAGWALRLKPNVNPASWTSLKFGRDAKQWFCDDVDRLLATISAQPAAIPVMQDGGVLSEHLHSDLDEPTWQRVRTDFFGA